MSILESEAEQARAQHSNLVKQYRAIGSRAIAAAVAAMKKRKPKTADGKYFEGAELQPTRPKYACNVTPVSVHGRRCQT